MSETSNAVDGTAEHDAPQDEERSQEDRHTLWRTDPNEAEAQELDEEFWSKRSGSASEPDLGSDKYCLICPESINGPGSRHASFGNDGTTATVSRYGDIMQVTKFLGMGTSGIFSMDHTKTRKPYHISERARDLDDLSETIYGNYTYGLFMKGWPTKDPDTVKWVNWRWPRYEWVENGVKTVFQYYVHDGIVLHQLFFHNIEGDNAEGCDLEHDPSLSGEMRLQDVDYLSCDSQDEQRGRRHGSTEPEQTGPCGYGRVQSHSGCQVMAVIDVFVDGRRTKIPQDKGLPNFNPLGKDCTREIVVAYRLSLLPDQPTWRDFIIPATKANVEKLLWDEIESQGRTCMNLNVLHKPLLGVKTQDHDGTSEPEVLGQHHKQLLMIQYLAARHLEHILSACAIPFPTPENPHPGPESVALTCGDISGHRICTSASYYAFVFLIEVDRRLKEAQRSPHIKKDEGAAHIHLLRDRIRRTCGGHIKWIDHVWSLTNTRPLTSGHFAADYWVKGKKGVHSDSNTWEPPDPMTDTAFQILKIAKYASAYNTVSCVHPLLTRVFVAWLQDLHRLDPRQKFAWPRPKQDGVDTYRLEDHFWIWKALKAMEDLDVWSKLPKPKRLTSNALKRDAKEERTRWETFLEIVGLTLPDNMEEEEKEKKRKEIEKFYDELFLITRRLVPRQVQRGVLQRFTTVNDVSGERALAVNRSSRYTRFLLHDRDSAMLHDDSFFLDGSFKELWKQTLESQQYHPANEESAPDSKSYTTMRYALSIMMGARDSTLNGAEPSRALSSSFEALLRIFSHNGFIGEQLSWLTKEPVIFDDDRDRDSHFHASFEVLYILLTHSNHVLPKKEDEKDSENPVAKGHELTEILQGVEGMSSALKALPEKVAIAQRKKVRRTMEEKMPFNNHITSSNVCTIEEEWLYNYPEFFSTEKSSPSDTNGRFQDDRASSIDQDAMIVDAKKLKMYGKPRKRTNDPRKDFSFNVLSYPRLMKELQAPRRAADAKKRFIWMPNPNKEAVQGAKAAKGSDEEKQAMALFFNRHLQSENVTQDDTSLALNSWNSELHLSFHYLEQDQHVYPNEDDQCQDSHGFEINGFLSEGGVVVPQSQCKVPLVRRAQMSYRFNGDLFDRYWTCHFIESNIPQKVDQSADAKSLHSPLSPFLSSSSPLPSQPGTTYTCSSQTQGSSGYEKCHGCLFLSKDDRKHLFTQFNKGKQGFKTWWQRKVLEILLLERMLDKVFHNTKSVLEEIERSPPSKERESNLAGWELGTFSTSYLHLVSTLGSIEDNLTSILQTLHRWDDRAKSHGVEKPRWTLNDENKYRKSIWKEQTSLEERRSDIQKQKQRAVSLQKRFKEAAQRRSEKEERERALREQQSERNIRWFTYVTIVFAPLSFAEGFYSMSGAPPNGLTRSLATLSAVALVITVVLLFVAIKTFSAFKERESTQAVTDKTYNSVSVSKEKSEQKKSGSDKQNLPGAWDQLLTKVLDHLIRAIVYPTKIPERIGGTISANALPSLILGSAFGIIILPIFIILWLFQFALINLRDLYLLLKLVLYVPPLKGLEPGRKGLEPRNDEEGGRPRKQRDACGISPPQLFKNLLQKKPFELDPSHTGRGKP